LVYHDLDTGLSTLVATNTTNLLSPPQFSADGRSVAYESGMDVFVWNADTLSNRLVSASLGGATHSTARSHTPALSADGRLVVFLSEATDLVANSTGPGFQIFARDLTIDETELISVNLSGQGADGDFETSWPAVSADGRKVAFDGLADDLVPEDLNEVSDVFVRGLARFHQRGWPLCRVYQHHRGSRIDIHQWSPGRIHPRLANGPNRASQSLCH
jgi:Tol biopolymer transport system component